MSRQGELGMSFEMGNKTKGYPGMALYVDILGPGPEAAAKLRYILVLQDWHTKYALADFIPN